jgi:PBP1b-binding outer membrane lipoprotein LpoB
MKKILSLVIITVLMATGCSTTKTGSTADAKQKETSEVSFEYSAMTRGTYRKVIVKKDSVITATERDMKNVTAKKLSTADWNTLTALLKKIKPQDLPNLKAPSTKHQFDGALAANLQVITQGTAYQSVTFDHGNPPAEIKELTEKILSLSDLK